MKNEERAEWIVISLMCIACLAIWFGRDALVTALAA
jgi:hypothetical protein